MGVLRHTSPARDFLYESLLHLYWSCIGAKSGCKDGFETSACLTCTAAGNEMKLLVHAL